MSGGVKASPPDEVDKAVAAAGRAVGRLVRVMDSEDPEAVRKAAKAIVAFGRFAVAPLGRRCRGRGRGEG